MEENPRLIVIEKAVNIEKSLSLILGGLLDIDIHNSKTLGNKPSALGFKQKVDILTDMKTIKPEDAKKLQFFAEIRNQFVHNYECKDFVSCFNIIETGTKNGILKIYKSTSLINLEHEESLKGIFLQLYSDVEQIMVNLIPFFSDKAITNSKLFQYETFVSLLLKKFTELANCTEPFNKVIQIVIKLTDLELKKQMENKLNNLEFPGINNFKNTLFKDKNQT